MTRVVAIILHVVPGASAGALEGAFAELRATNARRLAVLLAAAGATVTTLDVTGAGRPFGARLRDARSDNPGAGLIVLGSGSVPLASRTDARDLVAAAATDGPVLANNSYSADILAIPASVSLAALPDLAADNGLPRWFADRGVRVADLGGRWRLQVDLDSPLDGLLAGLTGVTGVADQGQAAATPDPFGLVRATLERIRAVARDPSAELLVAGRTSARSLRWLEHSTRSRSRVLVEERGMRTAQPGQRPPRSVVGLLIERAGPRAFGALLADLADAAVIDSRVLLAHRLGNDKSAWPSAEDRFASDLLLHQQVVDPWLRELTRSAASASIPVVLGGHTLVGPGLRLLLAESRP